MPVPIRENAAGIDLSGRMFASVAVAGSPALAAETVVCSVTCPGDIAVQQGAFVFGFCSLTIGTSGTSVQAKLRRTGVAGTTVLDAGAVPGTAGNITERGIFTFDNGAVMPGQVYVMTITVAAGAAVSTVSAAALIVIVS